MKTPEQIEAWNEALETAAKKVKALSHGLDCSCDGCVARENDVVTILEQRIAEPANDGTQRPGTPDGPLATETRKPGSLK